MKPKLPKPEVTNNPPPPHKALEKPALKPKFPKAKKK